MAFDVIPCLAYSRAVALVKPTIPCLAETQALLLTEATKPWTEEMLIILPHLFLSMCGMHSFVRQKAELKFRLIISSHLLSGKSATLLINCMPTDQCEFTCIIDENIHSAEDFNCFCYQKFAIERPCQVSVNVVRFDVWICCLEVLFNFLQVLLVCEAVQNNIVISLGQCIGDSKTDAAQRAGDNGYLVCRSTTKPKTYWLEMSAFSMLFSLSIRRRICQKILIHKKMIEQQIINALTSWTLNIHYIFSTLIKKHFLVCSDFEKKMKKNILFVFFDLRLSRKACLDAKLSYCWKQGQR